KPAKFHRLVGDEVVSAPVFGENMLSFAVTYGLAIQGLKLSKLQTNLLPHEIRTERLIRSKKPWAIAAAVALFTGAAVMTAGYAFGHRAVTDSEIKKALVESDSVMKQVDTANNQAKEKQEAMVRAADDVKSIIAGKDEQLNWIKLCKYINECL